MIRRVPGPVWQPACPPLYAVVLLVRTSPRTWREVSRIQPLNMLALLLTLLLLTGQNWRKTLLTAAVNTGKCQCSEYQEAKEDLTREDCSTTWWPTTRSWRGRSWRRARRCLSSSVWPCSRSWMLWVTFFVDLPRQTLSKHCHYLTGWKKSNSDHKPLVEFGRSRLDLLTDRKR